MMFDVTFATRRRLMPLAVSMLALMAATPALAQQAAPSTLSMLNAMVKNGIISQEQADKILKEAAAEDAAKGTAPLQAASASAGTASARGADGAVHVQYVPQAVKDQIKAEVKQEVMAKAQNEGWAAPNQTPEWTQRVKVSGDLRVRSEEDMFPKGNTIGSADQVNFASLNNRSTPLDVANLNNFTTGVGATGSNATAYNNWNQPRERERLRARLAIDADLDEGFSSGMRLATGADNSPVSTNQTMGNNFSKYQMWLDRAYIKYAPQIGEGYGLTATAGRFANPFFSSDLVWNNDINLDGFAASGKYQVVKGVTPFVTLGAFPVYNTSLDFSTSDQTKTSSQDRWLYAGQVGTDWQASKTTNVKVGAAYYYFNNIEGKQTDCDASSITCASDVFRPTFAQHGNTYMDLRNNYNYNSASTTLNHKYQYFGLASGFHELALTGKVDYDGLKPIFPSQKFRVSFDGDFVKNLAFDKSAIQAMTAANITENNIENSQFNGGDTGYLARLTVGTPELAKRWDWNVSLAYKYIESDAVVDAFNDSDFGMGGTNLKGYILGANLALAKNVWTSFRWMSADSISGAPYASDVVFLDINAKF